MAMLTAKGIHKRFGAAEVLRGVSLSMEKGEVVAIIGPSGSGKSTFLRCLNRLETVDAGEIQLDGEWICREENGRAKYAPERKLQQLTMRMGIVQPVSPSFRAAQSHFGAHESAPRAAAAGRGARHGAFATGGPWR